MTWLEDDPPTEIVSAAAPIEKVSAAIERLEGHSQIRAIEDQLHMQALEIHLHANAFREIDPMIQEPPAEWIAELGEKKAWQKFRAARAAWLPAKEAPVAFALAKSTMINIIKARATEKSGDRNLNVQIIQMNVQLDYDAEDVED